MESDIGRGVVVVIVDEDDVEEDKADVADDSILFDR